MIRRNKAHIKTSLVVFAGFSGHLGPLSFPQLVEADHDGGDPAAAADCAGHGSDVCHRGRVGDRRCRPDQLDPIRRRPDSIHRSGPGHGFGAVQRAPGFADEPAGNDSPAGTAESSGKHQW